MVVEIKVYATLRDYVTPSNGYLGNNKWNLPEGTTVGDVLSLFNIPEEQAKVLLIQGRNAKIDSVLKDGDVLHIFPLMCGG